MEKLDIFLHVFGTAFMYNILREFVDSHLTNLTASCMTKEGNGSHIAVSVTV